MAPLDHGNRYHKSVMMVVMGTVGGGVWRLLPKYVYRCSSEGRSKLYVISGKCEGYLCQVFSMYQGLAIFVFSPALTLWLKFADLCYNYVCIAFSLSPSL